ncbi:hypothetical protein [Pseudoxanthomonas mexicana]|uniref:hypothetical protein n=1 Tax=Pseudoxanthomonas mexicana TaxID=128785 RepID=UPI00209E03F6|nr:hypothetical protein [Pseudoxanthomonas mexicana]MCP1582984.1 hypothetical protein [Pseudoxanthomonas mexicana]
MLCAWSSAAQEAPATDAAPPLPVADGPAPPTTCCVLPDGTPLVLEILDPISSARVKRGDMFRLRLKEPVTFDGVTVLTAGIEGVGEIVHAEPSRGGGKPGELILAARRLQVGDRTLRLRGFKLGGAGRDTSGVALGVALGIGPFAHFIHGKEIEIPALTAATAKLAEPFPLDTPESVPDPLAADPTTSIIAAPDLSSPSATPPPDHQE